jgi:transposase
MNPMEQNMLEAQKMQAQGMKQRIIAEHFGVTERTVRNWLKEKPRQRKVPERKRDCCSETEADLEGTG